MLNHLPLRSTLFRFARRFTNKHVIWQSANLLVLFILLGASAHVSGQSLSTSLTFPKFNSSYIAGTTIEIRATATTPVSTTVAKVEFFYQENFSGNYIKIGEDLTTPYSYTWTLPTPTQPSRSYQIRTIVTNTASNTAVANPSVGYYNIAVYRPDYVSTRNWYVSAVASATNTAGTEAAPFNTLQKATDRVAPGDTVFIMGNTPLSGSVNVQRTGLATKWIVIMPYKNDKPVIKMNDNDWNAIAVQPAAAYIRIQGLEVIGNSVNQPLETTLPQALTQPGSCENPAGSPLAKYNGNGITVDGRNGQNLRPHHITISNNVVHDCGGAGIATLEADYLTVEDNTIYNNSWYTIYGASGISFLNSWNYDNSTNFKMIIRNNRCYGNRLFIKWNYGGLCKISDGNGIILDNNNDKFSANPLGAYTGQFLVENNLTYLNGGRGININYSDNVSILNNTTYQNAVSPEISSELVVGGSNNDRIYNNIFYVRADKAINIVSNSSNIIHNNNLTFGGTGTPYFSGDQNKVGLDPQFTDAAGGNFQLASNSPAFNAGSSIAGQYALKDILGVSRPQGAGVDMGAYELLGAALSITQQPASSSVVCAGGSVSVSIDVSGPVNSYQWYKDGVSLTNVTSATTATLSLNNVTTEQQGSYTVVITGFNSLTSSTFSLTVNAQPTASLITSGPIECTTPTVTLTGSGGVSYAFSGPDITAQSSNTATVTSAGSYSVLVTSPGGCTASASSDVTGSLTTPEVPNASSVTATHGAANVILTVSNCAGTVNWNGVDGGTSFPVSISVVGVFVYSVTCKVGVCASPVTSVTVTVNAPPSNLSVFHRDGDNNQTANNVIRPYIKLTNEGTTPVPYSEITVRYWLTVENFAPLTNLSVYWAELGTSKVRLTYVPVAQPRQGAFGYIEYSFDTSAGNLVSGSNSGEIQTGIGKQNWSVFNEADDYSFSPNTPYTKNDRITVYRNGTLVGGIEPAAVTPLTTLKVYSENRNSNPATNQISTHLKLANDGNLPVDYSQLTVRYWFSSEGDKPLVHTVDYADLGGSNIRSKFVKENRLGTDTYLEMSFVPTLGSLNPLSSTGIIQYRINKNDWSSFNEVNDYSYQAAGALAENLKITAYLNGTLIYGQEPSPSGARVSAEPSGMRVVVLGNPIEGNVVKVVVSGVEGQPLHLRLTDIEGRVVAEQSIERATNTEVRQLSVGRQGAGLLLLQVSIPSEGKILKLIKH